MSDIIRVRYSGAYLELTTAQALDLIDELDSGSELRARIIDVYLPQAIARMDRVKARRTQHALDARQVH
jgi:hypothetical protein